jgi:hypothetical protein
LSLFSTGTHSCVFFALIRGKSAKIGENWGGGRTKTGPSLHQFRCTGAPQRRRVVQL